MQPRRYPCAGNVRCAGSSSHLAPAASGCMISSALPHLLWLRSKNYHTFRPSFLFSRVCDQFLIVPLPGIWVAGLWTPHTPPTTPRTPTHSPASMQMQPLPLASSISLHPHGGPGHSIPRRLGCTHRGSVPHERSARQHRAHSHLVNLSTRFGAHLSARDV